MDRHKYMTDNELAALRRTAERCRPLEWLLVDLATQTGLRVSELARLRVGDVDPRCSALRVVRSKKRHAPGKPRLDPEWLPVSSSLMRHLVAHIGQMGTISPEVSLWRDGLRGPWTTRGMQQAWKRVCARAGLPPEIHIHQARHTFAVMLLKSAPHRGQAMRLVQKQLGHSSIEMTATMYADVTWEDRVEALDKLFATKESSK